MSLLCRASLIAGLLLVGACKHATPATATPEASSAEPDAASSADAAPGGGSVVAGVAHSGNIDLVALDPTGTAAVSRDIVGGLRLWPVLDGSKEPQAVPIANPRSMAVVTTEAGFVVLGVEASGGARFVAMQADGHAKDLASLPPFNPVQQVVSLHGEHGPRFAALMRDGSIQVFGPQGDAIVAFDEKGFQPSSIRASADGQHIIALSTMDRVGSDARAEGQRLSLGGSKEAPTLTRTGTPQILKSTAGITETTVAFSPDGSEVAVLARGMSDHWDVELFDLSKDEAPRKIEVQFNAHQQPHLGYSGPSQLLVSSNEGLPSKLIDTKSENVRLRTSIPQDFNHQGRAQASASGRQVVGYGTFLFVHDVDERQHRFLGYRATQGSSVGLSPSGTHVAWAYSQGPVVVEAVDGSGEAVEIDYGTNNFSGTRVRFIDEEHIIIVDAVGEVSLVRWKDQEVVARAGTMSNVRGVQVDPVQGLFVLERYTNEAWVYEVSPEDGFKGPYIVGDAYRLGLLRPEAPSDLVLWSLQASNNKTRQFTLDQLRADLTVAEIEALGVSLPNGHSPPLAVDRKGRHYGVRWNGASLELFVMDRSEVAKPIEKGPVTQAVSGLLGKGNPAVASVGVSKSIPSNDINQILPSPEGDRFVAVVNRAGTISAVMYDSETLDTLWTYSTGVFNTDTEWSDDGRYVAFSANTGAVLVDAATGEAVLSRCGLRFTAFGAPPSTAFSSPNQKSICEL